MTKPIHLRGNHMTGLSRAHLQNIGSQRSFSLVAIGCCCNMRTYTLLLGVLLLVDGVFGADEVKYSVLVMKGDSVTLNANLTDKQKDDPIMWTFEGSSIARINTKNGIKFDDDARFKDRLKLDKKTGSLTITNITPEHLGLYQLYISGENEIVKIFNVNVLDVVESVSVMEGDTVSLHTGVTKIQKDDVIQWFGDQGALIADLNSPVDARRSNIHLNYETGDLIISNIQRDQSGDYKVEITRSSEILHFKFHITFSGVFSSEIDGVKSVSVMEGKEIILHTRITSIPADDVIEWTFGPQTTSVVKTDRKNGILIYNEDDRRFTDKLYLNIQTGDLNISDINTEASGLYQLKIIKRIYTIEKSFRVTVTDTRVSGAASGIFGAGVGLVAWAVTVFLLREV